MLSALDETGSVKTKRRPGPRALHEQLIAHHLTAGQEREIGDMRICRYGGAQGGQMKRRVPLRVGLDMVEPCTLTDRKVKCRVDLIVNTIRAFVALNQGQAGARRDHDQGTRKHRRSTL